MAFLVCTGQGIGNDHCCYLSGQPCPFLVENIAGRRYACGLRLENDSWPAVIGDPRYRPVGEHWESIGQPFDYCMSFDPVLCCQKEAA